MAVTKESKNKGSGFTYVILGAALLLAAFIYKKHIIPLDVTLENSGIRVRSVAPKNTEPSVQAQAPRSSLNVSPKAGVAHTNPNSHDTDERKPANNSMANLQYKTPVGVSMYYTTYTLDEFLPRHPEMKGHKAELEEMAKTQERAFFEIESKYPGEVYVLFTSLQTSCALLPSITVPVALRIDGYGNPLEVVALESLPSGEDVDVSGLKTCHFTGGPQAPFVTLYFPGQSKEN